MSQLTTLAERIKVITTIQKTAHAMQLIAMSNLSRITAQKKTLQEYRAQVKKLSQELNLSSVHARTPGKKLYLIIGSQKGFCGSFNALLWSFVKDLKKQRPDDPFSCIPVGPYAYDFCLTQGFDVKRAKSTYSLGTLEHKTAALLQEILALKEHFTTLSIISNSSTSIFVQKPQEFLISLRSEPHTHPTHAAYRLEQPFKEVHEAIYMQALKMDIFQMLLDSLQAENSARALAMDSSTRNAEKILGNMKIVYNKMRQAKVTKELIELTSSL